MKDVGSQDFQKEVLERSKTVPVVVDFWAPWCGPCRVLGPVLETEVSALGGRVELVKINTDENPELAQAFQIQGIPAVKAFRDGKVVAEFVGAQPAPAIRKFLAPLAPPAAVTSLASAEAALQAGRPSEAEATLRALTEDAQVGSRARLLLARIFADTGRGDEAQAWLGKIDEHSPEATEVPLIERRLAMASAAESYGGEAKARADLAADPKNLEARWALASALAPHAEPREALDHFLEIASTNRKFKEDGARLAMLALFDRLGTDHELTQEFRRRLQIVL